MLVVVEAPFRAHDPVPRQLVPGTSETALEMTLLETRTCGSHNA